MFSISILNHENPYENPVCVSNNHHQRLNGMWLTKVRISYATICDKRFFQPHWLPYNIHHDSSWHCLFLGVRPLGHGLLIPQERHPWRSVSHIKWNHLGSPACSLAGSEAVLLRIRYLHISARRLFLVQKWDAFGAYVFFVWGGGAYVAAVGKQE